MYASIRKLAPKLLLFGLGRISNFWLLLSLAEELSFRWCCLSCMQSSNEKWTACTLLLFAHSLPYCTGCCTGTTCQNICALSKYLRVPIFWEFSPIFRGRLLSSQNSNQRAVKEKVVHFGLLFQMSPMEPRGRGRWEVGSKKGRGSTTDKQMASQAMCWAVVKGGGGSAGRTKTASSYAWQRGDRPW